MINDIVKNIEINNVGEPTVKPIGAEAENIVISRNANADIIEDLNAPDVEVIHTESVATVLKNIENKVKVLPNLPEGTTEDRAKALRNSMGLGNTLEALPIANGGTGKTSIASGKVLVGNGTKVPTERGIVTSIGTDATSTNFVTEGACAAMKNALQQSFQHGVDTIYDAFDEKGITPTASTPQALADAVGDVYTKGKVDAESATWTEEIKLGGNGDSPSGKGGMSIELNISLANIVNIKCLSITADGDQGQALISFLNSTGTISSYNLANNTSYSIPNDAITVHIFDAVEDNSSTSVSTAQVILQITRQAKILR